MKRISQLDGLRGAAILAVYLHHSLHIKMMWMGVDLFFVLSGFLITGVLLSAKELSLSGYFAKFYGRRVRRILPPYLVALVLLSVFFGIAWTKHWPLYIGMMNFLRPLNLQFPPAAEPFWSLAVEEQFYFFWPFAVYFLSEQSLAGIASILIVAAPVLRGLIHFSQPWPIYMLTPFRMDLLATGALLCLIYRKRRKKIEDYGWVIGPALSGIGILALLWLARSGVSTYGNTRTGNILIYEGALACVTGIMLWALSGKAVSLMRWRPLRWVGQISYSMYLVHLGVILLLRDHFRATSAALIGLVITLAYATVSWILIEGPLLGNRRKETKVQKVAPVNAGQPETSEPEVYS
jgi:peptidoglycan/LPS O-acetylase OafA/YrhL